MTPRSLAPLISLALALVCATAHAQQYQARYERAVSTRDYRAAALVLREALSDRSSPPTLLPTYRLGLATVLLRAGSLHEAATEARQCSDATTEVAAQCAAVLREAMAHAAPTTPAPVVEPPRVAPATRAPAAVTPAPTSAAPVVRVELRTLSRSWSPGTGPIVLWSLGAASLATAGALALARADALGACSMRGDTAVCPDQASLDYARSSVGLTVATNTALVIGAVSILAGTSWWAVESSRPIVVPTVTADGASLALSGRW